MIITRCTDTHAEVRIQDNANANEIVVKLKAFSTLSSLRRIIKLLTYFLCMFSTQFNLDNIKILEKCGDHNNLKIYESFIKNKNNTVNKKYDTDDIQKITTTWSKF